METTRFLLWMNTGFRKKFLIDRSSSFAVQYLRFAAFSKSAIQFRVFPVRDIPQPYRAYYSQIKSINPIDIARAATTAARFCVRVRSGKKSIFEKHRKRKRKRERAPRESRKWIVFCAVINLSFDVRQKFIAEPRWRTISASVLHARWRGEEGREGRIRRRHGLRTGCTCACSHCYCKPVARDR